MESEHPKIQKKKLDFPTEQFIRSIKHWTDTFISGEIKVPMFLESLERDTYTFCHAKGRIDEFDECNPETDSVYYDEEESSGDIIDVDE